MVFTSVVRRTDAPAVLSPTRITRPEAAAPNRLTRCPAAPCVASLRGLPPSSGSARPGRCPGRRCGRRALGLAWFATAV